MQAIAKLMLPNIGAVYREFSFCCIRGHGIPVHLINSGNEYPPIENLDRPNVRAGSHEDINLITPLVGASAAGLEVLTRQGTWLPITVRQRMSSWSMLVTCCNA